MVTLDMFATLYRHVFATNFMVSQNFRIYILAERPLWRVLVSIIFNINLINALFDAIRT